MSRPQKKTEIKQQVHTELYSGVVPPPSLLEQFNKVDPTFADRIFKMAEAQNEHSIKSEERIIRNNFISKLIGQLAMLFIIIAFLTFTFVSLLVFKNAYAGIAGVAGTVIVAAIRKFPK